MKYYCSYFDQSYFSRGLALLESMNRHCGEFIIYVLCLDSYVHEQLTALDLEFVRLITRQQLEAATVGLAEARSNRSQFEYYFTCSPALPMFVLRHYPGVDVITYLDADLYFYSNPEALFSELGEGSVGIIRHKCAKLLEDLYGIYNVGWVTFRRDNDGLKCLSWWLERCLEWCSIEVDATRFADQKYLDYFPAGFNNVVVLEHKGANVAPWSIPTNPLRTVRGELVVDGWPMLFFHFHNFKQTGEWLFSTGFDIYNAHVDNITLKALLAPYIQSLLQVSPTGLITSELNRSYWKYAKTDEAEYAANY